MTRVAKTDDRIPFDQGTKSARGALKVEEEKFGTYYRVN